MFPPPVTTALVDIGFDCTDEELFMLLQKITTGSPLPGNVINDVNPHNYLPQNLPEHVWYLIPSMEDEDKKLGFWRAKGKACELFSNSVISGWRTTLEFFEGQFPHERKTDWIMQEYSITKKGLGESSKDASSLCRVFRSGKEGINHGKQLQIDNLDIVSEAQSNSTPTVLPKANNDIGNSSGRNTEAEKDDETRRLPVAGSPLNYPLENAPELDYLREGDYLELYDLENPASRSSSSDNWSCMTISSNEYFDSLALLRDIESESNRDFVPKDGDSKFSVSAALRPDEMVMFPPSPGSFISIEESRPAVEEFVRTEPSISASAEDRNNVDRGISSCHDKSTSSRSHTASRDGEKKADKGRMKKLKRKYFCFMPF